MGRWCWASLGSIFGLIYAPSGVIHELIVGLSGGLSGERLIHELSGGGLIYGLIFGLIFGLNGGLIGTG